MKKEKFSEIPNTLNWTAKFCCLGGPKIAVHCDISALVPDFTQILAAHSSIGKFKQNSEYIFAQHDIISAILRYQNNWLCEAQIK